MANTITKQTIHDGPVNLVVKITIDGDASGDETVANLVDVSTYSDAPGTVKIMAIHGDLDGFSATLKWDADTDVLIATIPDGSSFHDFYPIGGLNNTKATGYTGDILMSTNGLGNENGSIILEMRKS